MPRAALSSPIRAIVPALALSLAAALSLPGCSPAQHQVIDENQACVSCHADDKASRLVEGAPVPSTAMESGSELTVRTSEASVVVCRPEFASEDGSYYVPVQVSTAKVDGEAVLKLEDGLWAICIDEGDTARSQLVRVDSASDAAAVVEL